MDNTKKNKGGRPKRGLVQMNIHVDPLTRLSIDGCKIDMGFGSQGDLITTMNNFRLANYESFVEFYNQQKK